MSEPTHQQIIDAYEALDELKKWANNHLTYYGDGSHLDQVERILSVIPPRPNPTMDEIVWDDNKHFLSAALHPEHGEVVMLVKDCFNGNIGFLFKDEEGFNDILYTAPRNLTPTANKYVLKELY